VSVVRRAEADEWQRFRAIRLRALEDAPDAFGGAAAHERGFDEDRWRSWFEGWDGGRNAVFVAEDGDRWIGVAVGSNDADGHAHLYAMWTEPVERGRGVGRALVETVVAWAREESDADALELWVTEGNEAAVALYRSCGFAPTGARSVLREGSDIATVAMSRPLGRR
jgi:GNAT superfamily N-acetyltransferase